MCSLLCLLASLTKKRKKKNRHFNCRLHKEVIFGLKQMPPAFVSSTNLVHNTVNARFISFRLSRTTCYGRDMIYSIEVIKKSKILFKQLIVDDRM